MIDVENWETHKILYEAGDWFEGKKRDQSDTYTRWGVARTYVVLVIKKTTQVYIFKVLPTWLAESHETETPEKLILLIVNID